MIIQKEHIQNITYFFLFGNNPALSLAEIKQFVQTDSEYILTNKFLIITPNSDIDPEKLIKTLGGTIKIGTILLDEPNNELKNYSKKLFKFLSHRNKENKFYFGFSVYGNSNNQTMNQIHELGMKIKKEIKLQDTKCRFVTSKEPELSSVIVQKNKLVSDQGIELCFLNVENRTHIGKTLVVQDFKTQSELDFGRPASDSKSGMVPPKLARMMINIASKQNDSDKDRLLLDPFCGSGTVLQEALLSGIKTAHGTDASQKAIADTQTNLEWLKEITGLNFEYKVWQNEVETLSDEIESESVDLIVTEPFLGPPLMGNEKPQTITKNIDELSDLYSKALSEFKKILKPGGVVCMIWPVFTSSEKLHFLPIYGELAKNDFTPIDILDSQDKKNLLIENQGRGDLMYKREGQKVFREIVIFKK